MTEEKVRQIVTHAIDAARPHPIEYYHLCWWEDEIQCHHIHHTKKAHPVFLSVLGDVLVAGLSAHYWRLLVRRIGRFSGLAERVTQEQPMQNADAPEDGPDKRSRRHGRCFQKMRAPVNSPWFRIWTVPGSYRLGGGVDHAGGRSG